MQIEEVITAPRSPFQNSYAASTESVLFIAKMEFSVRTTVTEPGAVIIQVANSTSAARFVKTIDRGGA